MAEIPPLEIRIIDDNHFSLMIILFCVEFVSNSKL